MDWKSIEEKILQFWKENDIPEKVREASKHNKKFYFLDGPPYATGYIHMGTTLNKILKDAFIRFFRMNGYWVWDKPGYDCHGLPIENKVEQKLGFKGKQDIEKYGVEKFVEQCRSYATQFIGIMNEQFWNLGVWMDWKNPYLTLTNEYIEGAWATFKEAFKKGFLFRGKYPVHVCPHCMTALAYNEIEYKTVSDPAIYFKFKLKDEKNRYLVMFTTTPWTIPSNTGVMVKPSGEYAWVRVGKEFLLIGKNLVEEVMEKAGIKSYEIVEVVKGDTPEAAKKLQKMLIHMFLQGHDKQYIEAFVNDYKNCLLRGEVPVDQLVIWKTLRKDIDSYKSTAPHVSAAKIMKQHSYQVFVGDKIPYFWSKTGAQPYIKECLSEPVDYKYYWERIFAPIVERTVGIYDGKNKKEDKTAKLDLFFKM